MSNLSADEIAMIDMTGRWLALDAVAAREEALMERLRSTHPDATGVEGWNAMMQTMRRFNRSWPHAVPSKWEMVNADRAGKLREFTANANQRFKLDSAALSKDTA